jgi:hypothetical protein
VSERAINRKGKGRPAVTLGDSMFSDATSGLQAQAMTKRFFALKANSRRNISLMLYYTMSQRDIVSIS